MKDAKLWTDTIHGLKAECRSKTTAWQLIRGYCHENGLEVPTFDKIIEVNPTPQN